MSSSNNSRPLAAGGYSGRVVYMFAYDLAYDMTRQPLTSLLGRPIEQYATETSKRTPRQLFFYRPRMIRLPSEKRVGPHGTIDVERTVKLFPVGAVSISVSVPFEVAGIEQLVDYHDLRFAEGSLDQEVHAIAEQLRLELAPYCIRPVEQIREGEVYTVFCIRSPMYDADGKAIDAEDFLLANRRQVAALLTQEANAEDLSEQEATESTGKYLSYYQTDLAVLDWDAAMVIDDEGDFDQILHIMELANVQLAELEEYDRILDESIERSYRDLSGRRPATSAAMLRSLREIRVDLTRLSDELSNNTKFFGDWHLARIYQHLSDRFHLSQWHSVIDEKLKTLDDLYELFKQEHNNRWMMLLEAIIVLLFVIDLVIIVLLGVK